MIWLGIRPKTLTLSLSPILLALLLAIKSDQPANLLSALIIALSACSIQIATNLLNDARDFHNNTDTQDRIGPQRITQAGLATYKQTTHTAYLFIALAAICGAYLVWCGGFIILAIGSFSLMCAYGYSAGPLPISRGPFGEIFVLLFFGIIPVSASVYLICDTWIVDTAIYGSAIGFYACAILLLNNFRDSALDKIAGRHTLAILIGDQMCRLLFTFFLLVPFPIIYTQNTSLFLIPALIVAGFIAFKVYHEKNKQSLNRFIALTALCQLLVVVGLTLDYLINRT